MNDEALMTNDERITNVGRTPDDFEDAFWNHDVLTVIREEPGEKRTYDLEERTARFGEAIRPRTRFVIRASSLVRHPSFGIRHSDR